MYTRTGSLERTGHIDQYVPMVKKVAHHMVARLPANVDVDDLIQAGMIGLMDAVERFVDGQGAQFETYASQRIRGAMLDELRRCDWMPRSVRQAQRKVEQAVHQLENQLGLSPSDGEIADYLGLSLNEYQKLLLESQGASLFSLSLGEKGDESDLSELLPGDSSYEPMVVLKDKKFKQALVNEIERLPEREKLVMALYYEEELNLKETAAVLGVTESRACQIHSQAVARLRARLKDWK